MQTYVNPISGGQDPYCMRAPDGYYYNVYAGGIGSGGLFVAQSDRLSEPGVPHLVWSAPAEGWNCGSIWAPELHYLRGRYYIYFTTAAVESAWFTRRQAVLEADSPLGPYREMGMLELGDEMSIDGTVLEARDGRLYYVFMRNYVMKEMQNTLWIAPMSSPTKICGEPQPLSAPIWPWEEFVNEGPEAIRRDGKLMIVYSAHAAHTSEYCLALLVCNDEDRILDKSAWTKYDTPCFRKGNGVSGPGHASMTVAPDGITHYLVYHCKSNDNQNFFQGYSMWRMICVQPFTWDHDGKPLFGSPLPIGEPLPLPPGENEDLPGTEIEDAFLSGCVIFYGGRQHYPIVNGILYLDSKERPEYGCKAVVRGLKWECAEISLDFRMPEGNDPDDGILLLLRANNIGARRNLMQGYAVRVSQRFGLQFLRYDGWSEPIRLAGTRLQAFKGDWLRLKVTMNGTQITAEAGGVNLTVQDETYASGRIGVAASGNLGIFKNLMIKAK